MVEPKTKLYGIDRLYHILIYGNDTRSQAAHRCILKRLKKRNIKIKRALRRKIIA